MLILHISDIHFREPDCLDPSTDPERAYRTLLIRSVREQVVTLGSVGAIVVGGDIAFKGHPAEYVAAADWLRSLATSSGCPPERIFVVPGNHDVDRRVIGQSAAVRNAHHAILNSDPGSRERQFRTQLRDPETGRSLFKPLAAYNEFAKNFNCQVYAPDRLYWRQDLMIPRGVVLRIHGLTSVLLSGVNGDDDRKGELYLSPLQTVLEPVDNVVHAVLAHHPPDWLLDHEDVEDLVGNRAKIHFFGHKHRQRITRERNYLRYSAGAVNPDRAENGWCPGYNLTRLSVVGGGSRRKLRVFSRVLRYQPQPEGFVPLQFDGESFAVDELPIPGSDIEPETDESPPVQSGVGLPQAGVASVRLDPEAGMSEEGTRNLVFRFWKLTSSERREVVQSLGLIEEGELALPEPERYGRALIRASERNLIEALGAQVAQKERQ